MPRSSQSTLPSRSYDRTFCRAVTTISVRSWFAQTNGVDQFSVSSRTTRHNCSPLSASNAVKNDSVVLSLTTYSRPPCSTGEAAGANS